MVSKFTTFRDYINVLQVWPDWCPCTCITWSVICLSTLYEAAIVTVRQITDVYCMPKLCCTFIYTAHTTVRPSNHAQSEVYYLLSYDQYYRKSDKKHIYGGKSSEMQLCTGRTWIWPVSKISIQGKWIYLLIVQSLRGEDWSRNFLIWF